ncbi:MULTISPECIES: SRPBCC domain-containing protein [Asticcacaulis]|uniref:SRPBCC domain-containing protein n=1 Tax=Asticcacaulis TaxID=76890 RepID=UPI001AE6C8D1|nr:MULTISPECIES: SRPBCC domain-containing protein [Asticcacaulis]MBP2161751.1 uncharacterized protein YndB with AHSA1/START domain [Asticcacaulis solisilvae]MDR6802797.1 uncharacterized protein YndB with AHSA1/START domain [Asticcacaulis sp. BE141]
MPAVHATFITETTYPHPVAKVFTAFSDTAIKARWFSHPTADGSYDNDFRLGGSESSRWVMDASTPFPGAVITSEGLYLDIVPERRIASGSNMMMNGTPFSASLVTFEFEEDGDGTRLICTHHGAYFENADGPEMRKDGWQQLLGQLAAVLNGDR